MQLSAIYSFSLLVDVGFRLWFAAELGSKARQAQAEARHRASETQLAARQILTDARRVDHDARMLSRDCVECRVLAVPKRKGEHPKSSKHGPGRPGVIAGAAVRFWHPGMEGQQLCERRPRLELQVTSRPLLADNGKLHWDGQPLSAGLLKGTTTLARLVRSHCRLLPAVPAQVPSLELKDLEGPNPSRLDAAWRSVMALATVVRLNTQYTVRRRAKCRSLGFAEPAPSRDSPLPRT